MSDKVVFFRPVEKVSNIVDTLESCNHSFFPIVDTDDNGVLFGTVGRNELCVLLQQRAFGFPATEEEEEVTHHNAKSPMRRSPSTAGIYNNFIEYQNTKFFPLVEWPTLEKAYPKYPRVEDVRLTHTDRDAFMDLRPYANTSPVSVQEKASLGRTYELFRTLGMRFLPVVNRHNQVVGTITRADLSEESLAGVMLIKGKKNR